METTGGRHRKNNARNTFIDILGKREKVTGKKLQEKKNHRKRGKNLTRKKVTE